MSEPLTILPPAIKDIGDFDVRRLLPAREQRSVGPFVFWDHFGPVTLPPGRNMDVRPHPHIGLSTLTWLFAGEIMHRDSLGYEQNITPGSVNWMTAGRGIVHSERTPEERRGAANPMHGLQIWMALPEDYEEVAPGFQHYPAKSIPQVQCGMVTFDLIAGSALAAQSPVEVYSPLCYLSAEMSPGDCFDWPRAYSEQAIYVVEGAISVADTAVAEHHMVVLPDEATVRVESTQGARIALLAGEPLGQRYLYWNFVSSSRERLREAAQRWEEGGFDRVPGDDEAIPLPNDRPRP